MDLTSIKYSDDVVEFVCCGYLEGKLVYKILAKVYDHFSKYGVVWDYFTLAMVFREETQTWILEYLTQDYDFLPIGEMKQTQYLPYGHILPLDCEHDIGWTKIYQPKINGLSALKARVFVEQYVLTLRENLFGKIRPFTISIYPHLGKEMKTRILELVMIFNRLFRKEQVNLPSEMTRKVLWFLEVIIL